MLEDVNVVWALAVGAAALVLGPASGIMVGLRGVNKLVIGLSKEMKKDREETRQDRAETREWLKALQTEVYENKVDIAVERAHRTSAEGG